MSTIIPIIQTVAADKQGYEFLCDIYDKMHDVENEEIIIDFEKCKSFDANLSAVLGAMFDKRQNDGCKIFFRLLNLLV